MEIHLPANDIDPLCDFCCSRSDKPVAALLVETRDFKLDGDPVRRRSEGEWYVCRECLLFIMQHNSLALALRSSSVFYRRHGWHPSVDDIRTVHATALDQLKGWPA